MKRIKEFVVPFLSAVFLVTLAGCGGGDSGSGGGGGASQFAGTYTGTETLTFSSPATPLTTTGTFPLTIVIASVTITDVDGQQYTGDITGNTFTASAVVAVPRDPDVSCQSATVIYTGSISDQTATGSSTGTFTCTAFGTTADITVAGPFTATRNNSARAPLGTGAKQRAIIEMMGFES